MELEEREDQKQALVGLINHYYDLEITHHITDLDKDLLKCKYGEVRFVLVEVIKESDSYPVLLGEQYLAAIHDEYPTIVTNIGQMAINPKLIKPLIEVSSLDDIYENALADVHGLSRVNYLIERFDIFKNRILTNK